MRSGLVAMLLIAASTSGCATLGYRLAKQTDTYRYDRDAVVEVHTEPEGAVVFEDGKPIGTAPFTYHAHHPVERKRQSRSGKGILVGCVLDGVLSGLAVAGIVISALNDRESGNISIATKVAIASFAIPISDCVAVALINAGNKRTAGKYDEIAQVSPYQVLRHDTVTERPLARTLSLEARWPDWSPVRSSVVVPDDRLVTLTRGHHDTFDDAIVHHARASLPFTHGGLLRAGRTYQRMALETHDAAHARAALGYFEQYLAGEVGDDERAALTKVVAELRALAGAR